MLLALQLDRSDFKSEIWLIHLSDFQKTSKSFFCLKTALRSITKFFFFVVFTDKEVEVKL